MDTQVLADAPASSMPLPPPAPAVLPRRPALHGAADFVSWTWEMVNAGYDDIGWSADGSRITIKKPDRLASLILPLFFRHSQYASWVRALNAYHFKKVGTGQWHHPCFHRDRPELLKKIVRKPREPAARPALSSSTALNLRVAGSQVGAILAEERSRLWWLKQEMRRLEGEVREAEREDLRQRWEAVALTQYIFEQMKLAPKNEQEQLAGAANQVLSGGSTPPLLRGGGITSGLLGGGSMQEHAPEPEITMLSSAMMADAPATSTAMTEGSLVTPPSSSAMTDALMPTAMTDAITYASKAASLTNLTASELGGAARGDNQRGAARGDNQRGAGHPSQTEAVPQLPPLPQPPSPSRISSRDLANLDLSEITLLSQNLDLRELGLDFPTGLNSPRSLGLSSPLNLSAPASPLRLASATSPEEIAISPEEISTASAAARPPRLGRDNLSSLSLGSVGSVGSLGSLGGMGGSASELQKATVDYYFNQLSLMAEHGLQQQGLQQGLQGLQQQGLQQGLQQQGLQQPR